MQNAARFCVTKKELLSVLKQMQRVEKSAKKKTSTLEGTIVDNFLQLAIPGVQVNIHAVTKGSAKNFYTSVVFCRYYQDRKG